MRGLLFVFEDLVKLDERAIQQVLREVDQKDLALALRGASEEVKERLLANMSERGARDAQGGDGDPCRRSASATSRRRRAGSCGRAPLEEAGTIVIARGEEEESEAVV